MRFKSSLVAFAGLFLLTGCTDGGDGAMQGAQQLSGAQCGYFSSGGRTRICHATGSASNCRATSGSKSTTARAPSTTSPGSTV